LYGFYLVWRSLQGRGGGKILRPFFFVFPSLIINMGKEKTTELLAKQRISEAFSYFTEGRLFRIAKGKCVSFYEAQSAKAFLRSLRGIKDTNGDGYPLKILEPASDNVFLLLKIKTIDSDFQLCDDDHLEIYTEHFKKEHHIRIYLEFLVEGQIGIKIVRLYSDLDKAFIGARARIEEANREEIQFNLYDGLDGDVIGALLEEL
jgi:hypothetical protein